MKIVNAVFELAVGAAALIFLASNVGELFDPATHPQWRFGIVVSLLVAVVALACFAGSVRRIRRASAGK